MAKVLPCINTQQIAAKKISKDQQTLTLTHLLLAKPS